LLAACESKTLIILPTDLLSASEPLIAALEHAWTEGDGAIVLTDEDGNHSPCIKIAKPMLPTCNAFLDRGDNKLSGLLSALSAKAVPVTSFWLRDADRPADMPTQWGAR
jgi:molybdopterin-guanine dinucleotide biosynthesis protein A